MDFNESAQPQAAAQAPSHFDTPNAFDQFDSTNTIALVQLQTNPVTQRPSDRAREIGGFCGSANRARLLHLLRRL